MQNHQNLIMLFVFVFAPSLLVLGPNRDLICYYFILPGKEWLICFMKCHIFSSSMLCISIRKLASRFHVKVLILHDSAVTSAKMQETN